MTDDTKDIAAAAPLQPHRGQGIGRSIDLAEGRDHADDG